MMSWLAFSKKNWIRWAGMAITLLLFLWLILNQDWQLIWLQISGLPFLLIFSAFLLYFLNTVGNTLRWFILVRSQKIFISFPRLFKIVVVGGFVSNFLPSTIGGDGARVLGLRQSTGNLLVGVATVFVDRALGVLNMVLFSPVIWIVFGSPRELIENLSVFYKGYHSAAVVPGFLSRFVSKFKEGLTTVRRSFSAWKNQPFILIQAFGVGMLSRLLVFIVMWIISIGLGMNVTLIKVMAVTIGGYVVSLLPISFNGYGISEITITSLYALLGAELEQSIALAILTRSIVMLETLPGAFWLSDLLPAQPAEALAILEDMGRES